MNLLQLSACSVRCLRPRCRKCPISVFIIRWLNCNLCPSFRARDARDISRTESRRAKSSQVESSWVASTASSLPAAHAPQSPAIQKQLCDRPWTRTCAGAWHCFHYCWAGGRWEGWQKGVKCDKRSSCLCPTQSQNKYVSVKKRSYSYYIFKCGCSDKQNATFPISIRC